MSFKNLISWIVRLPKLYSIGGAVVLVAVAVVGSHALTRSTPAPQASSGTTHVSVSSVAGLSSAVGPLPVTGKVTSLAQASILSQSSGEIVTLAHSIGDHVGVGALIAAFENSSQQAAVQQAQGAYDAAVAALAKANGSQSAENTGTAARAALSSAAAALDDAVHTRADQLMTNARTAAPALALTVPDNQLVDTLIAERIALEGTLQNAAALANDPTQDIDTAIAAMSADTQATQDFLDNLIKAVNETPVSQTASAATLSADQTLLATARTEVVSALTSLASAKSAYDAAVSPGSAGTGSNDVKAAQANVMEALGSLNAAKANLEKTLVRSPISGTIVSLPVKQGDYVSTFAQIAVVSNPAALYVDVQVTPADAKTLALGNKATIADSAAGVITFIAPALDPSTGKIEVKVGITDSQGSLTDGEVVSVALSRTQAAAVPAVSGPLTIPIIAAKITPQGPVVFTVTASSTLAAHPITFGSILGDQVVVTGGLTPDMEIVTDARGLAAGQAVVVDTP